MMASLSRLFISMLVVPVLAACTGMPASDESSQMLQAAQRPQFQNTPVSPRTRAEARTALALGYYERGQFDVALEELDEAKKLDDRYAMIYNGYGLVYSYMREDDRARSNFQRAIELDPNNPEIRHNWGWFLCTSGQARESLAEFNRVALDPLYRTPEIAFTNAGRCALSINDNATARHYLERALRVRPDYVQAAYSLAELSYGEGKFDEARVMMRIIMQTPTPTVDALFLGACVERKLNDKRAEDSYIQQLQNRYPNAEQTQRITTPGSCP
ncbi:MAG: type IV pilus biogenesis/stability protein PilW [Burkholderiales bacterium]|jgi:type IV pilus assembly protein PilF|nr:type IV pilus biogenesis/stability protein PilW [Burkholderiales bacterium]